MHVKDVMTKDVKSCSVNDALNVAAQIMWDGDCGCVPVVNDKLEVVGMITDRDICMAAYTQNQALTRIPVAGVMSREVYGCGPEDAIDAAERVMRTRQVRRLPVLGFEGQLLGILSLNDLACAISTGKSNGPGLSTAAVEATLAAVCRPRATPRQTTGQIETATS